MAGGGPSVFGMLRRRYAAAVGMEIRPVSPVLCVRLRCMPCRYRYLLHAVLYLCLCVCTSGTWIVPRPGGLSVSWVRFPAVACVHPLSKADHLRMHAFVVDLVAGMYLRLSISLLFMVNIF